LDATLKNDEFFIRFLIAYSHEITPHRFKLSSELRSIKLIVGSIPALMVFHRDYGKTHYRQILPFNLKI